MVFQSLSDSMFFRISRSLAYRKNAVVWMILFDFFV